MRRFFLSALVAMTFACGAPRPTHTSPAAEARAPLPEAPPTTTTIASDAPGSTEAPAEANPMALPIDAPAAAPTPVVRTGNAWPFHAWDRAEAVTFNHLSYRPRVGLYAYDEHGWSSHLVDRKPLASADAKKAVELVVATEGDVEVSKCTFPRHAVILYDRETPIASINVCFECGDILLWPRWEPASSGPTGPSMTAQQIAAFELRAAKQMKLYDKAFPRWQAFFRDQVGFPIDARYE
jgi:hypothetical protein